MPFFTQLAHHFLPELILTIGVLALILVGAWRGERATQYDLMEAHHDGEIRNETTLELSRRDVSGHGVFFASHRVFNEVQNPWTPVPVPDLIRYPPR